MQYLSADELARMRAALNALQLQTDWQLKMADRSTHQVYTALSGLRNLTLNGPLGKRTDVTSQLSAGWQEQLTVLQLGGELLFEVAYPLDAHDDLLMAGLQQTMEYFELTLLTGLVFRFAGLVDLQFVTPGIGPLQMRVRIHMSGVLSRI